MATPWWRLTAASWTRRD